MASGVYAGDVLTVHSFIDKNGQEKMYKNGIKANGEKYSFFKFKDSKKGSDGKYIQLPYTYILFTENGEYLEKDMRVKVVEIISVNGSVFGNYTQIIINAKVEILGNEDKVNDNNNSDYINNDISISDDDLPF